MTNKEKVLKRLFDIFFSFLGLISLGWIILLSALVSYLLSGENGFFKQTRVGQNGVLFSIYKIRTITSKPNKLFIRYSKFLRRKKIDEFPQLLNVILGSMSLVGPRPDLEGYADKLEKEDQIILQVKPGITGPATIVFKNEDELLNLQEDKEKYNREVIWPQKVLINKKYVEEFKLKNDVIYLLKTLFNL